MIRPFRSETERAETGFGPGQFQWINVEADQSSAGPDSREDFLRVAAITERAVHGKFAGLGREHFQDFRHHDGPVGAGGSFAGRDDLGDGVGVAFGLVFLVFFLEAARVRATVTRTPPVRCRHRGGRGAVGHAGTQCVNLAATARTFQPGPN